MADNAGGTVVRALQASQQIAGALLDQAVLEVQVEGKMLLPYNPAVFRARRAASAKPNAVPGGILRGSKLLPSHSKTNQSQQAYLTDSH